MTQTVTGVLLVVLCSIIEGIAQTSFKRSALETLRRARWLSVGIALFVVEALIYTIALQFVEVSTAFPIGSISFVVVTILSRYVLNELVTGVRWIGVALVVAGVTLLAVHA